MKHDRQNLNNFRPLLRALLKFPSNHWINQYFDLQKRLLSELSLKDEDPRLALTITKELYTPFILGRRYVLAPKPDTFVRCIVPADFNESEVNASFIGYFSPKTKRDAKWVEYFYPTGSLFPPSLFNACVDASLDILKQSKKSSFRKNHDQELYYFTMEPMVRTEILRELNMIFR